MTINERRRRLQALPRNNSQNGIIEWNWNQESEANEVSEIGDERDSTKQALASVADETSWFEAVSIEEGRKFDCDGERIDSECSSLRS
jgi:hypothetical protein